MASMKEFREERIRKLEKLRSLGYDPYPAKANRTVMTNDILADFDLFNDKTETVFGRIKSIRKFGKIAFIVVRDFSGAMQLFLQAQTVHESTPSDGLIGIDDLNLLDTGDFIEATGKVIKTKTGETSLDVTKLRLITKALRPMPLEHESFTDKEERLRRRYVDMNVNLEVRDRFVRRSHFWQATRNFLISKNFIEINNNVLEATAGGADATP